jgi:hypothetical protein
LSSRFDLLTPLAALVVVAVAVPLLALGWAAWRGARARRAVGLPAVGYRHVLAPAVALVLACGLVALAAAQPVLRSRAALRARTDAAAWIVVDTSRSMLAANTAQAEPRIVRARRAALRLRAGLASVPVGVASVNDRVLPHLFPSPDRDAFDGTIARTIRPGQPTPIGNGRTGTNLTSLAALPTLNFFPPEIRHRAVIVVTDAESDPIDYETIARAFRSDPPTDLVLLRVGSEREQVYDERGRPEADYDASASAPATAARIAAVAGGTAFVEGQEDDAVAAALAGLGRDGPAEAHGRGELRTPLAPYAVLAAAVPLAWLIRRRNLK